MSVMSCLTSISSLPTELLYTILSHALADILFDHLFVGALLLDDGGIPNDNLLGLDEISSLGRVSVAWRATLHRILAALLHVESQVLLKHQHQQQHKVHRAHQLTRRTQTARAHPSPDLINSPISSSTIKSNAYAATTIIPSLHPYQRTLHTMQTALRDLVQHSIDAYRNEQDLDATMGGGQAGQTGVTTPTLLPPPPVPPVQPVLPLVQPPAGNGNGAGAGTPPLVPHSIPPPHPPHSIPPTHPPASMSIPNPSAPTQPPPVNNHLLGALLLIAAPTLKQYAATPLFQAALCYSQAAIFTCQSSNSNSFSSPTRLQPTSGRWNLYEGVGRNTASASASGASAGMRTAVRRPDLSTLVLTTPRLVAALEWVRRRTRQDGYYARVCPREVCEVVECGMGEVRERIEDAIRVCRWNDLLHAVFLRGERSEEMLEALDGCFDDLEENAGSIQMHHLLRSNLFKTVQTIARLGPISISLGSQSSSTTHERIFSPGLNTPPLQAQSRSNTPLQSSSNGEIWRSRAGALAFRWMGRVVEWTGL